MCIQDKRISTFKYALCSFKDSAESNQPLSAIEILQRIFCKEFGCTISSSAKRASVNIILLSRLVLLLHLNSTQLIYFMPANLLPNIASRFIVK